MRLIIHAHGLVNAGNAVDGLQQIRISAQTEAQRVRTDTRIPPVQGIGTIATCEYGEHPAVRIQGKEIELPLAGTATHDQVRVGQLRRRDTLQLHATKAHATGRAAAANTVTESNFWEHRALIGELQMSVASGDHRIRHPRKGAIEIPQNLFLRVAPVDPLGRVDKLQAFVARGQTTLVHFCPHQALVAACERTRAAKIHNRCVLHIEKLTLRRKDSKLAYILVGIEVWLQATNDQRTHEVRIFVIHHILQLDDTDGIATVLNQIVINVVDAAVALAENTIPAVAEGGQRVQVLGLRARGLYTGVDTGQPDRVDAESDVAVAVESVVHVLADGLAHRTIAFVRATCKEEKSRQDCIYYK